MEDSKITIDIMDRDFNFLGTLDKYSSLMLGKSWSGIGTLELHLDDRSLHHEQLLVGRVIYTADDRAYLIDDRRQDSDTGEIVVKGWEVKHYLSRWLVFPPVGKAYHALEAPTETIMKTYVADTLTRKGITLITVAPDLGRGPVTSYQARYGNLAEVMQELSQDSGLGWDIRLDHDVKRFVFDCYTGLDRTEGQSENSRAVFSIEEDTIRSQELTHSQSGYANTAIVAGQGEGEYRIIEEVGATDAGLDSYEIFVDARDIEYDEYLADRGRQKLAEMPEVLAFESVINPEGSLYYREDFNLGDRVTAANRSWGISADLAITSVMEIYEQTGFRLDVTFGEAQLTLTDRIKQLVGGPITEGGGAVAGWQNIDGGDADTVYGGMEAIVGGDAYGG